MPHSQEFEIHLIFFDQTSNKGIRVDYFASEEVVWNGRKEGRVIRRGD